MPTGKYNAMKKIMLTFGLFVLLGSIFISCDQNRYYEKNEAIDQNIWYYRDAKTFEVDIVDSLQAFNFYINVRNTIDYEYANLYFFIKTELPNGKLAVDTIECQLANLEGKWLGSGSSEFRDNSFILRQNMRFTQKGMYRFYLKHGMRSDSLQGIADVGIRLEISK